MNIGIDIDDTISLTYEATFPRAEKFVKNVLKRELELDYSKAFDHHFIKTVFKITEEEMDLFWKENLEEILNEVEPKKNVAKIINKLKEEGHKIILITARWNSDYANSEKISEKWLEKHGIQYDKMFIGLENKAPKALEEKIDLFIDDSIRNYKEVSSVGIKSLLFKSEVNSRNEESKKLDMVNSWDEIYDRIKSGRI